MPSGMRQFVVHHLPAVDDHFPVERRSRQREHREVERVVLVAPLSLRHETRAVHPRRRAGRDERAGGELADAEHAQHVVAEIVPAVEHSRPELWRLHVFLNVEEIDPDAVAELALVVERAHRVMRPIAIEARGAVARVAYHGDAEREAALVEMRGHADAGGVAHRVRKPLQHRVARLHLAQEEKRRGAGRGNAERAAINVAFILAGDRADRHAVVDEEFFRLGVHLPGPAEALHDEHRMLAQHRICIELDERRKTCRLRRREELIAAEAAD